MSQHSRSVICGPVSICRLYQNLVFISNVIQIRGCGSSKSMELHFPNRPLRFPRKKLDYFSNNPEKCVFSLLAHVAECQSVWWQICPLVIESWCEANFIKAGTTSWWSWCWGFTCRMLGQQERWPAYMPDCVCFSPVAVMPVVQWSHCS